MHKKELDVIGLIHGGGSMPFLVIPEIYCWECNTGISLPVLHPGDIRANDFVAVGKWFLKRGMKICTQAYFDITEFFFGPDADGYFIDSPLVTDFYEDPGSNKDHVTAIAWDTKKDLSVLDELGIEIVDIKLFNQHMKGLENG